MDGNGGGRVTIRSIARETGLSIATVSRALQESPSVRAETINTVVAAADRLGYRRNPAGAGIRTGRTEIVCLLMPIARPGELLGDVGALRLVTGASERLAGSGYGVNLVPFSPADDPLDELAEIVRRGNFDGIVLSSTRPEDERVRFLDRHGVPFVTFGRTELPIEHAFYDVDNEDFALRATRLLIARGCRRPAIFTPPRELLFARHRVNGFRQALGEAGIPFDEAFVLIEPNGGTAVAEAIAEATRIAPVDGYLCAGEVGALAVLRAVEQSGRKVGRDVHLATMETSILPSLFHAPVSGFFQDLHWAGVMLAEFILRRMAGTPPAMLQLVETMSLRERA